MTACQTDAITILGGFRMQRSIRFNDPMAQATPNSIARHNFRKILALVETRNANNLARDSQIAASPFRGGQIVKTQRRQRV
jgi:hypothetical protein